MNINAIILEIPLAYITKTPEQHRIVNTWGESWVLKAANKVETIPDDPFWLEHPHALIDSFKLDDELKKYKLVDTDGQPFADAALERARGQPADGREQLLAGAALHQAAGAPRLGLRAVDQRARAQMRVRSRQLAGVGAQDLLLRRPGVPAGEERFCSRKCECRTTAGTRRA